jgi:hypothetical protein
VRPRQVTAFSVGSASWRSPSTITVAVYLGTQNVALSIANAGERTNSLLRWDFAGALAAVLLAGSELWDGCATRRSTTPSGSARGGWAAVALWVFIPAIAVARATDFVVLGDDGKLEAITFSFAVAVVTLGSAALAATRGRQREALAEWEAAHTLPEPTPAPAPAAPAPREPTAAELLEQEASKIDTELAEIERALEAYVAQHKLAMDEEVQAAIAIEEGIDVANIDLAKEHDAGAVMHATYRGVRDAQVGMTYNKRPSTDSEADADAWRHPGAGRGPGPCRADPRARPRPLRDAAVVGQGDPEQEEKLTAAHQGTNGDDPDKDENEPD